MYFLHTVRLPNRLSFIMQLELCTYENTPRFSFVGQVIRAKCVKVYDGDSCTVVFDTSGKNCRHSIRLDGYDCPELRSKSPMEKKCAVLARDFLASVILDTIVQLKCKDFDKYGRILADIEIEGICVNQLMIDRGFGRIYHGGHKSDWDFTSFPANTIDCSGSSESVSGNEIRNPEKNIS